MSVKSPRFTVVELLNKMDKGAYSNLLLDSTLNSSYFSKSDKKFISHLFYGIIERKITLEYIISSYSSKPLHKLDSDVINILKIGLYQLKYMDTIPDNAAVNETVNLTKQVKKGSASGFVNAVLRNFIRDKKEINYPDNKIERLSIEYSCNLEIVKKICLDYSYEIAENFLKASLDKHNTFIRVNNLKITSDDLITEFNKIGIQAEKSSVTDNCILLDKPGNVADYNQFTKGYFHVQDLSSQLCCKVLNPKPGETVIDLCAAPGGKTFTVAELMKNQGKIIAGDLHEKRVNLIKIGAEQLGINIIEAIKNDAKNYNSDFPLADKILCDVPCSGLGVIRSKPEIKYIDVKKINNLPQIQYEILSTAAQYLKKGGELVYSTCTINKEENDMVIDKFLRENRNFEPVDILQEYKISEGYKATIFPMHFGCEGFFISKIRKVD
ncbi:MAG: 16S rRNA (cytosine(967)-C(5))-methyltransferase RsmB [Oscillospiraceae bacterium]|nr:16S rRNA (cytosine(967)-C(5))-methyltransferase RsmB [Oscillospiraceae bacterium]